MRTVSIIYMSICNERKLNYMFYARQLIKRLLRGAQVDFLSVYTWAMKCNVCVIYQVKIKNKRKPCADLEECQKSPPPPLKNLNFFTLHYKITKNMMEGPPPPPDKLK